jgi:hypothetical protein
LHAPRRYQHEREHEPVLIKFIVLDVQVEIAPQLAAQKGYPFSQSEGLTR